MTRRKRNPQEFTTDEAQTASLILTEGTPVCAWSERRFDKAYRYYYPRIAIDMCDKDALLPAQRVLKTKLIASKSKRQKCPTHLFPPDGRGIWRIAKVGRGAEQAIERLKPLLTKEFLTKWETAKKRCRERARKRG